MRYFFSLAFTLLFTSYSYSQSLTMSVSGGENHQGGTVMHWRIGGFSGSNATGFQLLGYPIPAMNTQANFVDEQAKSKNRFYPNPFSETLNIKLVDNIAPVDITIYDITGMAISTVPNVTSSRELNLSGLADGIYLLRCVDRRTHQVVDTRKLIKKH